MSGPRDLHLSQPLRAVDQMHREPDPNLEAEAEARTAAKIEADREQARMRDQLLAFEVKLVGDRVQRQTNEIRTLIDIERRREAIEAEQLVELRSMKAAMLDLAKPDATQEALLAGVRDLRDLFVSAVDALQALVSMKSNGHAH